MLNKKVLFICLGNICRSPVAEAILKKKLKDNNLQDNVYVDSAGTAGYHEGDSADPRMIQHASKRGYKIDHIARKFISAKDFLTFDYIITMDDQNFAEVNSHDNINKFGYKIFKMVEFCKKHDITEVPDPYYEGDEGFEKVLDILEDGCSELLEKIRHDITT